nr:MAG TPA: hypothetical protein [Caudoviricetes sp.]
MLRVHARDASVCRPVSGVCSHGIDSAAPGAYSSIPSTARQPHLVA